MSITPQPKLTSTSPQIAPHPKGKETRLIDNGMLHYEASLAGFAERYGRGETSHTIHVWWARRPHSAMRALVFASLCKETSPKALDILKQLAISTDSADLANARAMLNSHYGGAPRLLDMFGGGGTIALEAANLGAQAYAIDANELSVFIQRCNLVYSQNIPRTGIDEVTRASGERVLNQLAKESAPLFPLREQSLIGYSAKSVYGYFWTYSMKCSSCSYRFYLSRRPWLSKKNGRNLALITKNGDKGQTIRIGDAAEDYAFESAWPGRNGTVQCPKCHAKYSDIDIKKCKDEIVALVRPAAKTGKDFSPAPANALPAIEKIDAIEQSTLRELETQLPSSLLPLWSGIVNPALYGVRTHADFLNRRQRAVLLLLVKALKDEYQRLRLDKDEDTARYVVALLSSFIDQLVDWNCRLSMWISQNEQVGRAFCGPGVPMLWDYVETDPVLNGPANLWSKLDRIASGAKSITKYPNPPSIEQAYAQALPYPDEFFDAIVTDPPYYDNIYYTALADFFYAWKRLLLRSIDPTLFSSQVTDDSRELVASTFRSKTPDKAHEDYCEQLALAMREAERSLKSDGVFSFVYSHSSLKGWDALVQAYRATKFRVTSVQPLSIERKARPRAMSSEAVNTCVTFVAHKSAVNRPTLSLDRLCGELRTVCQSLAPQLLAVNWNEEDTALAVFANGVAMLANTQRLNGATDMDVLRALEKVVKETIPAFSVKDRKSL
jgi:putative DNA methylase